MQAIKSMDKSWDVMEFLDDRNRCNNLFFLIFLPKEENEK